MRFKPKKGGPTGSQTNLFGVQTSNVVPIAPVTSTMSAGSAGGPAGAAGKDQQKLKLLTYNYIKNPTNMGESNFIYLSP